MARIYSREDYEGVVDDNYRRYESFDVRRMLMGQRWNAFRNAKVLIAGCGYGFLVADLIADGFSDVWGCDASAWAIQRAKELHPAIAVRFVQADITIRPQMNSLRSTAGLSGNQRFRATLTEDVLPCAANEAEAQAMLVELRRITTDMAHIITPMYADGVKQPDGSVEAPWGGKQMPGFLWLSVEEWRALIGPSEPIIPTSTYEVLI